MIFRSTGIVYEELSQIVNIIKLQPWPKGRPHKMGIRRVIGLAKFNKEDISQPALRSGYFIKRIDEEQHR